MNEPPRKRRPHFKNIIPADPAVRPFKSWSSENQNFYAGFRQWLVECGCGRSTLNIYGVAARQALGYLDKPYWTLDPDEDLARAWDRLQTHPTTPSTQDGYRKGLSKLAEYIRLRNGKPAKEKEIGWETYIGPLPDRLQADVRLFLHHCGRRWSVAQRRRMSLSVLSALTGTLRWIAANRPVQSMADLDPPRWFAYLDYRLDQGISPVTVNGELAALKQLLRFLKGSGSAVCERMLLVDYLNQKKRLPRDLAPEQLRKLLQTIRQMMNAPHATARRLAVVDYAWFLLMLHSGLRTVEVRALKPGDVDLERRQVRIEQSKGMKDRLVPLSPATAAALRAYLDVRGPAEALPESLFVFRHKPLSVSYCYERLRYYGKRCGVEVSPHRLRHSCASLLLNCGAPVLTVQVILGHQWVDTTLGYARLYDGTVAADYYGAMSLVEQRLALPEDRLTAPPGIGRLLALVDSLRNGTLNESQSEAVWALRDGLAALARLEESIEDVKVPEPVG